MKEQLEEIIKQAYTKTNKNIFTFLTGAGISSESGIPTYRGVDGIWVKGTKFHKPEEFGTFNYFSENPEEVWQYSLFRKKMFESVKPNESHHELVEIENMLQDRFHLITQNIDNLHRNAGTKRIYEIHGNNREIKCSKGCKEIIRLPDEIEGKNIDEDLTKKDIELLKCKECGSWMRPNILWFDEYYDEKTNKKFSSLKIAKNSGILFIIGTSGATNLPIAIAQSTLKYGGTIVDINTEDNQFTKLIQDKKNKLIIRSTSTEALQMIKEIIKNVSENDSEKIKSADNSLI
ncbi:Sir2 family NAD-dependent protein deacetylase [Flavobacterium sp. MC2016-06]|uniref:SIR2 family NAD-dependent protein deacylase n=1 Tax=Flavobacterium sp. MC2016-06 TaxID=2676308 RepID=UPI0012BAD0E5|nr:Sir2 family NAD-dependent protein deacetylase [Flavobacterium sp. MC2016-06]MBU3861118.1 iron dicitrate transport regulator FecR [Flavobacterium sp. MC2016-06]